MTFVSPDEEADLRAIERAIGRRIERVTLPGFDYTKRAAERLEVPMAERIAAIRAKKAQERGAARANAERRAHNGARPGGRPAWNSRPAQSHSRSAQSHGRPT